MTAASLPTNRETVTTGQYRVANQTFFWFAQKVRERLAADHKHLEFDVSPAIVLNITVATYDDIDRYKAYHLRNAGPGSSVRSDAVKRAAYFAKWITKLRPISFRAKGSPKSDPNDMALMANETLAVAYALELIGSELKKKLRLSEKTLAEILYDLHYRDMNDGALLAVFQMLRDLANDGKRNALVEIGVS